MTPDEGRLRMVVNVGLTLWFPVTFRTVEGTCNSTAASVFLVLPTSSDELLLRPRVGLIRLSTAVEKADLLRARFGGVVIPNKVVILIIMIFVEPQKNGEGRRVEQQLRQDEEARKRRAARVHPIQEEVLYIVSNHDEREIRKTTVAKCAGKANGFSVPLGT